MKRVKKFFADFKAFITRGNVLNLAVGVIIGAAFGKIVTSLVGDIIMPLVTRAMGAASLADLTFTLRPEVIVEGVVIKEALTVNWGSFLQNIIDFLIIAFIVFLFVRLLDTAKSTTLKLASNAKGLFDHSEKQDTAEDVEEDAKQEEEQEEVAEETAIDKVNFDIADKLDTLKSIENLLIEIKSAIKGDSD